MYIYLVLLAPIFREGNGTPLQYSCLENPMDGGAWSAAVPGVAKSWTRLSDFTFSLHFPALEKKIAIHSSVLAWRIPGKGEPGGLPSMWSHRVRHNWSNLAAAEAAAPILQVRKLTHRETKYLAPSYKFSHLVVADLEFEPKIHIQIIV